MAGGGRRPLGAQNSGPQSTASKERISANNQSLEEVPGLREERSPEQGPHGDMQDSRPTETMR